MTGLRRPILVEMACLPVHRDRRQMQGDELGGPFLACRMADVDLVVASGQGRCCACAKADEQGYAAQDASHFSPPSLFSGSTFGSGVAVPPLTDAPAS